MKVIQELYDKILDEIHDAREYAELDRVYREERPMLAKTFGDLSNQEIDHMSALHQRAVEIIKDYRRNTGEPPADMMAVYDYLHRKALQECEDVRMIQRMFRDGL